MSEFIEMVHYYLGEAYLADGKKEKACEHFGEARDLGEITEEAFRRICG